MVVLCIHFGKNILQINHFELSIHLITSFIWYALTGAVNVFKNLSSIDSHLASNKTIENYNINNMSSTNNVSVISTYVIYVISNISTKIVQTNFLVCFSAKFFLIAQNL